MEYDQLSRRRAEAVRDYLVSVWGIASRRIAIRERGLPENPTTSSEEVAAEENRRVEISSDVPEIMEPVTTRNIERQVTPPILRFRPDVKTVADIRSWSIHARQGAAIAHDIDGNGEPPTRVDWRMGPNFSGAPLSEEPIRYRMHVSDAEGRNTDTPETTIPLSMRTVRTKIVERTADKEIRRYNLILFDFNSPTLDRGNQRIVQRIRGEIAANAVVTISGYTDRMGDAEYNRKLSLERAETVARAANQRRAKIIGVGETEELYDNSLPEGRFLSRTVEIIVETPIQH
jgi:outer membrane protein OmpA-like peptidoglycan-associated protein